MLAYERILAWLPARLQATCGIREVLEAMEEQTMDHGEVDYLSSLYGGYWNHQIDDFCYMTNPYFPPPGLIEGMQARLRELVIAYPSTNWYLSSVLAEQLGLTHEQLVIANGASELISVITSRFVSNLAVPVPTFNEFINRARIQGKQTSPFTMAGRFELDIEGFIQHVRSSGSNSALLVRPNNPTGSYISKSELTYFLDSMPTLDLVLVDESFIDFVDVEPNPSASDMLLEYPNLMIVKSLSKSHGIPGLRLGYAATGNADWLAALRSDLPIWNINSLAQYFLEEMVKFRPEFAESCAQTRAATGRLFDGLGDVPYLDPYPTQGNFILCRTLHGFTGEELTTRLFEHSRTLINNCSSKDGLDDFFVRIATRAQEDNGRLIESLKQLGSFASPSERSAIPATPR